ncbi:MAG: hypothetical protein ABL901_15940 [Hyphomicrobiaceae bacterium]
MSFEAIWSALVHGGDVLRVLQPYAIIGTFFGMIWSMFKLWRISRGWRAVAVVVVHAETGARKTVATLPWHFATRAEVLGLVANFAKGTERLDYSLFRYDYKYRREILVPLPASAFDRVEPPT